MTEYRDVYMQTPRRNRALFRAEGSGTIGHGHVRRCLSLARALTDLGWDCSFYSPATANEVRGIVGGSLDVTDRDPPPSDLVVSDDYELDAEDETLLRKYGTVVLAIDDRPTRSHDCDFLLDASPGRTLDAYSGLVPDWCELLLGPAYALLAPPFAQYRQTSLERRRSTSAVRRVFVSFGASDRTAMTLRVVEATAPLDPDLFIDVAVTSTFPALPKLRNLAEQHANVTIHLDTGAIAELMSRADLAIGAAGTTSLERCCLGLPAIVVVTADNQRDIANGLQTAGAAIVVGNGETPNEALVLEALQRALSDASLVTSMSASAARLCDGTGAIKVASRISRAVASRAANP